jgi:hypothetical protein
MDVYEKATGIARWLLGSVALRELLARTSQRFEIAKSYSLVVRLEGSASSNGED